MHKSTYPPKGKMNQRHERRRRKHYIFVFETCWQCFGLRGFVWSDLAACALTWRTQTSHPNAAAPPRPAPFGLNLGPKTFAGAKFGPCCLNFLLLVCAGVVLLGVFGLQTSSCFLFKQGKITRKPAKHNLDV